MKLEWNVLYENFNARKIESFNIFDHYSFNEDVKKLFRKYKDDRKTFEEEVLSSLRYYFWSKCEWEIIVSDWPPSKQKPIEVKIDVFDQVMLNKQIFLDYVWNTLTIRRSKK